MGGRQWIPIVALMIVQPDTIAALPLASTFPILMRQGSRGVFVGSESWHTQEIHCEQCKP
eukprot:m.60397 g.60397  ORF g.60397 m.60397 type:complete len:60 (-) comp9504_c0_seq1:2111-2290(-)